MSKALKVFGVCAVAALLSGAVFGAGKAKMSLADAAAKIDAAVSDPSLMTSIAKQLSATDVVKFMSSVNAAIAELPVSEEERAATFLNADRAILNGATSESAGNLLAEVFATVPPAALTVMNEGLANTVFGRSGEGKKISDELYREICTNLMSNVVARCQSADNASVREAFAAMMMVRAAGESTAGAAGDAAAGAGAASGAGAAGVGADASGAAAGAGAAGAGASGAAGAGAGTSGATAGGFAASLTATLAAMIPDAAAAEQAKNVWIPAGLGKDASWASAPKSYEAIMAACDQGTMSIIPELSMIARMTPRQKDQYMLLLLANGDKDLAYKLTHGVNNLGIGDLAFEGMGEDRDLWRIPRTMLNRKWNPKYKRGDPFPPEPHPYRDQVY